MKIIYLLIIVSLFSCTSNEYKTFNLSANISYDLKTLEENTIKVDPTYISSKASLSQYILECIEAGKMELSKDGRQGTYRQLEDIIALNYADTTETIDQFEHILLIVAHSISNKWQRLNAKQNFTIDFNSNRVSTELLEYNFSEMDSTIQSNFTVKQVDAITLGSTITAVLNNPKYIWISKISSSIEIGAIDFHGRKKDFLRKIDDQLKSNKINIYSKWGGEYSELNFEEYKRNRIDSIFTFDPVTYEENLDVRTYAPFHPNDVLKVELTQLVCFNNLDSAIETFPLDITLFHKPEDWMESIFTIK